MTAMKTRQKPVLIIQHAPHEHPAALRRALESQAIPTLWIHPYRGEGFPCSSEISGTIALGGPMGANDDETHPWIRAECDLLRASVLAELPTVGICLGGQMIARALGGRVERHTEVELGWFPIELNEAGKGDRIMGAAGKSPMVYQWHQDTFHLPPGAVLLARSQYCERQAYRLGERVYGFQFHPEADRQLVHEWLSIEGVAEEILEVRRQNGSRTVQDPETQKNRARQGEKASLKITAAIASLFRRQQKGPVKLEFRRQVHAWATCRSTVVVVFGGSHGKPVQIEGRITTLLTIPAGDFIIVQEPTTLLWPIRLDDIVTIRK